MTYMAAQALVKTLLLTNSNLTTGLVTEGDYSILDNGNTYNAVVIPGSFGRIELAEMTRDRGWVALVDLFSKFIDETGYSTFGTFRDGVITTLAAGRGLSNTYVIDGIETSEDPQELYDQQGAGPFFIVQRLRLTITEFI